MEATLAEVRRNRMAVASMVMRDTGEWVGLVRYFPSLIADAPADAIEGGVWLHPKFWHAKLGLEISSIMTSAVFLGEPRLQCIVARTSKANRAVNVMVAQLGFRVFGEGEATREGGASMATLHHVITRSEWAARPMLNRIAGNQPFEAQTAKAA